MCVAVCVRETVWWCVVIYVSVPGNTASMSGNIVYFGLVRIEMSTISVP